MPTAQPTHPDRSALIEVIARAVHESVRAYQGALGEKEAPPWDEAEELQDATREAVEFALRVPTPGAQHEAWVASKRRAGWVYGPIKDPVARTHPSLVPFGDLSETEQSKDAMLIAVVTALASVLGVSAEGPAAPSPPPSS